MVFVHFKVVDRESGFTGFGRVMDRVPVKGELVKPTLKGAFVVSQVTWEDDRDSNEMVPWVLIKAEES